MHCENPSTKPAAPHFIDVMSLPWWGSNFHNLHHKTNETSTVAFNPKDLKSDNPKVSDGTRFFSAIHLTTTRSIDRQKHR